MNKFYQLFLLLILSLILNLQLGCNFYSWMPSGQENHYRQLIDEGNNAINKGQYTQARLKFEEAMALYPQGSEAYLFHSKALLKEYNLGFNELNGEFNKKKGTNGETAQRGVPFIDSATTLERADSVYYPIALAVSNLEHILRDQTDTIYLDNEKEYFLLPDGDTASDGVISLGVATLDLGLMQAIKAMLASLDIDKNMHVDSECLNTVLCKKGVLSEVYRFEDFKKLTANLDLDNLSSEDVEAKDISNNPNDINDFLDAMLGPVSGANFNLTLVDQSITEYDKGEKNLNDDLGEINQSVSDLNQFLAFMHYNDQKDNDFDGSKVKNNLMVWHDLNRDGWICGSP